MDYNFTVTYKLDTSALDELTDDELATIQSSIAKAIERQFKKVFGFTFPPVPDTIEYLPPPKCNCGPIMHWPGCKYANMMT